MSETSSSSSTSSSPFPSASSPTRKRKLDETTSEVRKRAIFGMLGLSRCLDRCRPKFRKRSLLSQKIWKSRRKRRSLWHDYRMKKWSFIISIYFPCIRCTRGLVMKMTVCRKLLCLCSFLFLWPRLYVQTSSFVAVKLRLQRPWKMARKCTRVGTDLLRKKSLRNIYVKRSRIVSILVLITMPLFVLVLFCIRARLLISF